MEIVLVRHAEPEWVRSGLSVDNPPLTERGLRQAELVSGALAGEHFDEILVSPLVRAQQTASPLLVATGRELVIEDWLEEIRSPIWHGTPAEKAEEAYRAVRARPARARWEGLDGGESVTDFVDRVNLGCSLFLAERGARRVSGDLPVWSMDRPEQKICLIAHAGTNSVVLNHLLGLEPTPWEWERFVLGHASVSRIQSMPLGDGHTFGLMRLSGDEHLPVEMRTR